MHKTSTGTGLAITLFCATQTAHAQIEPASVQMGAVALKPSIAAQTGYDDNIFSANTDTTPSRKTIITPTLELIAEDGFNAYRLTYSPSQGLYENSSDDNYLDHNLSADTHFEFDARNTLDLNATYAQSHEERGTGITEPGSIGAGVSSPLEYDTKSVSFRYAYGAENATGRLVLSGSYSDKEYLNFRSITDTRDSELTTLGTAFFYRIKPNTSLLFEVRNQSLNYKRDPASNLDSETIRYYIGATWDGTANTSGTIKLGQINKNFDSSSRDDFSGESWEAALNWKPLTYSTFDLITGQADKESTGAADFIDSKTIQVSWTHDWNSQLQSILSSRFTEDSYEGTVGGRKDEIKDTSVTLNYDMRRWLSVGLSYSYQDTESNTAGIPFDRSIYLLSVNGSL